MRHTIKCLKRTITIRKGCALTVIHHQRTVQGIFQQNVIRAVSQPPATICKPRPRANHTYQNQGIHAGAVTRHQHSVSHTQAGP